MLYVVLKQLEDFHGVFGFHSDVVVYGFGWLGLHKGPCQLQGLPMMKRLLQLRQATLRRRLIDKGNERRGALDEGNRSGEDSWMKGTSGE